MGHGGARMRDIRMEELPFEFDGKLFQLRCNMNVLADVQGVYNGSISEALSGDNPMQSVLEFTAAMLNDYADEKGWPERYTAKDVGRKLTFGDLPMRDIMGLVTRAMTPADSVSDPDTKETQNTEPETSGN